MQSTNINLFKIRRAESQNGLIQETFSQYEEKFADYEQLVILFIAGWVISLTFASKDDSVCLDEEYPGLDFTFRTWLWVNFGLSLTVQVLFMANILFAVFEEKSTALIALTSGIMFFLVGAMKIIWIIIGVFVFLYHLNFDNCSDFIIMYCSGEFLVFMSAIFYYAFKGLFKLIITYFPCFGKASGRSNGEKKKKKKEKQEDGIEKFIGETGNRVKKQLAFWGMIGWIYAMVLAKKDRSTCLDEQYEYISITFREWFWGDAITTLISLGLFTILAIAMNMDKNQNDKKNMFQKMLDSTEWIEENKLIAVLFILSVVFKFIWLLIGMSMFFADLNIDNCKELLVDYLILYFVWFIYLSVIFFIIFMDLIMKKCLDKEKGII